MRNRPWLKWLLIGGGVVVVLVVAVPFVYFNFIQDDAPDEFSLDDVQTDATTPTTTASTDTTAAAVGRRTRSTEPGRSPPAVRPATAPPRSCSARPATPRVALPT